MLFNIVGKSLRTLKFDILSWKNEIMLVIHSNFSLSVKLERDWYKFGNICITNDCNSDGYVAILNNFLYN